MFVVLPIRYPQLVNLNHDDFHMGKRLFMNLSVLNKISVERSDK